MKKSLSILIPAYNEEQLLETNILKLLNHIKKNKQLSSYEIIICDNASTDKTGVIGKKLAKNKHVKYVYTPIKGFGAAVKEGVKEASKEIVGYFPADGEAGLDFIDKCIRNFKENTVYISSRQITRERSPNLKRYLFSRGFGFLVQLAFSTKITDIGGIKFFKMSQLKKMANKCKKNDFGWQVEILYQSMKNGLNIVKIPLKINLKRKGAESKVSIRKDTISMGLSCIKCGISLRFRQFFKKL